MSDQLPSKLIDESLIMLNATHMIEGYPFGIERIAPCNYVVFRLWGNRRIYLRASEMLPFDSIKQAHNYLVPVIEKYEGSIIKGLFTIKENI